MVLIESKIIKLQPPRTMLLNPAPPPFPSISRPHYRCQNFLLIVSHTLNSRSILDYLIYKDISAEQRENFRILVETKRESI
jgi:hypothetical protein